MVKKIEKWVHCLLSATEVEQTRITFTDVSSTIVN